MLLLKLRLPSPCPDNVEKENYELKTLLGFTK